MTTAGHDLHSESFPRPPRWQALLFALTLLLIAGSVVLETQRSHKPAEHTFNSNPKPDSNRDREVFLQRARKSLDWADVQSRNAVSKAIRPIEEFFRSAQTRTPTFAADVLGWSSKWRMAADYIPFTKGDRHAEFLKTTFAEEIFTPEQLNQVVRQSVRNYVDDLKAIDNQMLVRIRTDTQDLPEPPIPQLNSARAFQASYDSSMRGVCNRVGADMAADAGLFCVSNIVTDAVVARITGTVLTSLGRSLGILGAGDALAPETLGVSLVAFTIVDAVVGWVWDWMFDPKGDLAQKVNTQLSTIRRDLVDGSGKNMGMIQTFQQIAGERNKLRRAIIEELATQGVP